MEECGVARRSRGGASESDPFLKGVHVAGGPYGAAPRMQSITTMLLFGVYLPPVALLLVASLFAFASWSLPAAPWLGVGVCALVLVVGAFPPNCSAKGHRGVSLNWFPLAVSAMFLVSGVLLGLYLRLLAEPWAVSKFLAHQAAVSPRAAVAPHKGAGVLHFADGARLDTASAAGFRAWPNTYCAAPVVAGDDPAPANSGEVTQAGDAAATPALSSAPGFWAVGRDCCEYRGSFDCMDAGDSEAKSGLRVLPAGEDAEMFRRAVRMASSVGGKAPPADFILVSWSKDPEAVADWAFLVAVMVLAASGLAACLVSFVCRHLLLRAHGLSTRHMLAYPAVRYGAAQ